MNKDKIIKTTTLPHILQNKLEGDLTAPEAQELAALKGANMHTIGDVYNALRSDADVGEGKGN
jgi:DNA-binding transcriptional regulator YhcF (GntR family)